MVAITCSTPNGIKASKTSTSRPSSERSVRCSTPNGIKASKTQAIAFGAVLDAVMCSTPNGIKASKTCATW